MNSSKLLLGVLIVLFSFSIAYASSDFRIVNVELNEDVFFGGDVVEGTIFIRNRGEETQQYQLELIYNNKVFVQGTPRFVRSGETAEQKFFWEVPHTNNAWITFRVYNEETSTTYRKNFLISSKTRDFDITSDRYIEKMNPGEIQTFKLNLYNKGTLDDIYEIFVENWEHYELEEEKMRLNYFESTEFSLDIFVPEDKRVGNYNIDLVVCNVENICRTRTINLAVNRPEEEQSIIKFDENQREILFNEIDEPINFNFSVENIGAERKNYLVLIEKEETDSELIISIDSPEFGLNVNQITEKNFKITPLNETDYTFYLTVRSKGETIFREEINLVYESKTRIGLTGMFFARTNEGDSSISWAGLSLLALVGIILTGYLAYRHFSKHTWREKAIDYTEKHPGNLTAYHDRRY